MISFVVYFSTAQEERGFVAIEGDGQAAASFVGGPAIGPGTYRLEGDELLPIPPLENGADEPREGAG